VSVVGMSVWRCRHVYVIASSAQAYTYVDEAYTQLSSAITANCW
jgi:hypothetical protein